MPTKASPFVFPRPIRRLLFASLVGATGCTSTAETGDPTLPPPEPPARVEVPILFGSPFRAALREVREVGLAAKRHLQWSGEAVGTVLRQRPRPGRMVRPGRTIHLWVARCCPRVPSVRGVEVGSARSRLRRFDFHVRVVTRRLTRTESGLVLDQRPRAGKRLRPGLTVWLLVAETICHPSYFGQCLDPDAFDYDCADGSGDGPRYTGFVRVVGPDVYELDGNDNDGLGCEP